SRLLPFSGGAAGPPSITGRPRCRVVGRDRRCAVPPLAHVHGCNDEAVLSKPPSAGNGDALDALRHVLEDARFTVEGIEERLGTTELSLRAIDTAIHLRRLDDERFGTLARLFLLGVQVDVDRLAVALAPLEVSTLADVGLLELTDATAS